MKTTRCCPGASALATSIVTVVNVMLINGAAGWAVSTPNNHR